jgi:hypothetical protein
MESHGDLDQSLKKLFVCRRCGAPDVFQGLMRVEELSFVEESDSLLIFFGIHGSFWHSAQGYVARGHSKLCLYELAMSLRIGYLPKIP